MDDVFWLSHARFVRLGPFLPADTRGVARVDDRQLISGIGRMFGRLNDFRRIATRYDRLARNYLAALQIAAVVSYWL